MHPQVDDGALSLNLLQQLRGLLGLAHVLTQHLSQLQRQLQSLSRRQRRFHAQQSPQHLLQLDPL